MEPIYPNTVCCGGIRDSQQTTDLPAEQPDPSVVEAIKKFHIDGGGLLLNTHAVAYLYTIGRMKAKFNTEFTSGDGFDNGILGI